MTAKDKGKNETGKGPGIRDLQKDEIDSVSGGKTTSWVDPEPQPVAPAKPPGWVDPDIDPRR
jgi:hypothetical protein